MAIRSSGGRKMEVWATGLPGCRVLFSQTGIEGPAGRQEQEIAGHAAMDGQKELAAQVEQQEFAPAPDAFDATTGQLDQKIGQIRMSDDTLPENMDLANGCSDHRRTQLARGIFNFW